MRRPDEDIRAEIIAELRWDPLVDADHVVVWLLDGVVALTGFVGEPDDVWMASLIAARVTGVRSVTNHLEVRPAAPAGAVGDGESIRVFTCEIMVPQNHLEVRVEDGRVTFEGAVDWRAHTPAVDRVLATAPDRRLTVLRALPRPPRWELEDWQEEVTTRCVDIDASSVFPSPL
jgi:hypothetical protein